MGLGKRFVNAIAASFIEVRLGPDEDVPAVPAPAPALFVVEDTPAPASEGEKRKAVLADGELNDAVVFADATLSPVPFTAEQALHVLEELPTSASAAALRCETMEQALAVLGDDPAAMAHQVVSDAAQKMVALNQFLAKQRTEVKGVRREIVEEMDELQDRLSALRTRLEESNADHQQLEEAGRARIDSLTGVIAFFDEFQAYLCAQREHQERPASPTYTSAFQVLRSPAYDDI